MVERVLSVSDWKGMILLFISDLLRIPPWPPDKGQLRMSRTTLEFPPMVEARLQRLAGATGTGGEIQGASLAIPSVMNHAEMMVAALPPADVPIVNVFTPGLYGRQVFIRAGVAIVTRIHKVRHQFVVSAGVIEVEDETGKREILRAPHFGITEPGTQRKLIAYEDTVWTTFHPNPTDETDPDRIVELVTEAHDNPLQEDKSDPRFQLWSRKVSPSLTNAPLGIQQKEQES